MGNPLIFSGGIRKRMLYSYERLLLLSFTWVVKRQVVVRGGGGLTAAKTTTGQRRLMVSRNCHKQCCSSPTVELLERSSPRVERSGDGS
jgi:hypothetical protein